MELERFRVKNYRCITDSGSIEVGALTALVGKNESGKTSILKALTKLNNDSKLDPLREFPRAKYHEFDNYKDNPMISATFKFSELERKDLAELDPAFKQFTGAIIEKSFTNVIQIFYSPEDVKIYTYLNSKEIMNPIEDSLNRLQQSSGNPDFDSISRNMIQPIEDWFKKVKLSSDIQNQEIGAATQALFSNLSGMISGNEPRTKHFSFVIDAIKKASEIINKKSLHDKADKYVLKHLPRFIYFDEYQTLESSINPKEYVQHLKGKTLTPQEKTIRALFKLIQFDVEGWINLESEFNKEEHLARAAKDRRGLLIDRASIAITEEMANLWDQRPCNVQLYHDVDYIRLWVVDKRDRNFKLEYEEQSRGFQSFFSFFIIFMAESDMGHRDSVILLDEPGLHLHPAAQEEMIGVLRRLSNTNQIIYTTHSPFMIDTNHLDEIRLVLHEIPGDSKILDYKEIKDKATLLPLQAAIGYNLSQSLFIGKRNLIVEGVTDYWLISSMASIVLREKSIEKDIVLIPAGGAQKIGYLASLMTGNKLKVGILFDSDPAGTSAAKDIIKSKLIKEKNVILIGDAFLDAHKEAELEDLFPEDYYIRIVNDVYATELGDKQLKTPLTSQKPRIIQRIDEEFAKIDLVFHKSRPARRLLDILASSKISDLPPEVVENFERLFYLINQRVPTGD